MIQGPYLHDDLNIYSKRVCVGVNPPAGRLLLKRTTLNHHVNINNNTHCPSFLHYEWEFIREVVLCIKKKQKKN